MSAIDYFPICFFLSIIQTCEYQLTDWKYLKLKCYFSCFIVDKREKLYRVFDNVMYLVVFHTCPGLDSMKYQNI